MEKIKDLIRNIPDFPKEGILFRDITTLLKDSDGFKKVIDILAERYKDKKIDYILGAESRGFIFGAPLAYAIGAGFIPVRKPGKLPYNIVQAFYELEYGTDSLEMHTDAIEKGKKVLIIDDLLATGGTAKAIIELVEKLEGDIEEIAFIIELEGLNGRKKLKDYDIYSMIKY
ncbi:adenine phosphoribosyltransferase [Haliovirga abyssi]|uniref:Adenine phosphoribosyltransferase n=1 Tax=Haliovirga abyssi TaxID=2996794 RepID=A0AAU9DDE7_9FUSO|nr:adenine phosphoribosyltransferase [Haliovirga abyssi]BDU50198.1 adenine phosphoribosyltransferase [Haliovirga abyssi]